MGLILCEHKSIDNPLYIEDIGLNIYSLEELCYVIYNYPYTSLDGLVKENFMYFINNELSLPVHGDSIDDLLVSILNFSDYYSSQEVEKFRSVIQNIRKLPKCDFYKNKGDCFFKAGKYGKAKTMYDAALKEASYQNTDALVYGRIYHNYGAASANLFEYDSAYEAYTKAYSYLQDASILKSIYFLAKQQPVIGKREKYLKYLNDRVEPDWDQEYENVLTDSYSGKAIEDFDSGLNKDSVKKKTFLTDKLENLKSEYRLMV